MKKVCLLIVTLLSVQSYAQNFPFAIPYDDSTTQTFLPHFPQQSINDVDFVGLDKDKFTIAGQHRTFWGGNLPGDGAFPLKNDAPAIASHMRKMGFNLMRFHHMDNSWGAGSFFLNQSNTRVFNETYRDRFEYFIAQLKNEGVYADVNLLVGRSFKKTDGIPGADSITDFGYFKSPALYNPHLIFLQKEYAKNLLTHLSPYTGKSLINDPVMAMVEIMNENSIYRDWLNNALKPLSKGGTLLYRYSVELDSLWNVYIKDKYATTKALQSAWNGGANSNQLSLIVNGNMEKGTTASWAIEKNGTTVGTFTIDSDTIHSGKYSGKLSVSNYDGTGWHLQLKQTGISIVKDSIYQVEFWAKSSSKVGLIASAGLSISPWTSYSYNILTLTSTWQKFIYSFKAPDTRTDDVRITFNTEANTTIWFDDISFSQPSVSGLDSTETIENATVKRTDYSNRFLITNARLKDQTSFYMELERNYITQMKSYLKDSLGVKVPITATNWFIGPEDAYIADKSDYIDNHAYFDHPQFPNVPWSLTDWFINNKPMINSQNHGTIPQLFGGYQLKDKPYTVSEYNHPYPNQYQSEMLATITWYSAFQGVDALMFFTYNGGTNWKSDFIDSYFDLCKNNTIMSGMPLYGYVFRNKLIKEASSTVELSFSANDIKLWAKTNSKSVWDSRSAVSNSLPLTQKVITSSFNDSTSITTKSLPTNPTNPFITTTNEITYDTTGLIQINTPQFIGAAGFLQRFPSKNIGAMTIDSAKIFGSIAWLSLDSQPLFESKLSVINLSSFQENAGMKWFNNNTTKGQWGKAPSVQYSQTIALQLHINAKALRFYYLDSLGCEHQNRQQSYAPIKAGVFSITLNQNKDKTLWYGLKAYDSDSILLTSSLLLENIELLGNPTSQELTVDNGTLTVKRYSIFDSQGKTLVTEAGNFTGQHSFTISTFSKGVYFISIETAEEKRVFTFVKM